MGALTQEVWGATIQTELVMSLIIQEATLANGQRLEIAQGDLTEEPLDAIVNAANAHLMHGGGVAGAILRKGGYQIQEESNAWVREHGLVVHAQPAYTSAGKLPCRYVIHAVGPVWGEGDEDVKLSAAVRGSLAVASRLGLNSIALPAISTGIFGFPKERAARISLATILEYIDGHPETSLKLVRLTLFDQETLEVFRKEWMKIFEGKGDKR
jgi:O-acetyl-ADP-ribose deacetylase (regulator of RNase III)